MGEYPITISIQYPEKLSQITTLFRCIMVIPQSMVLSALGTVAGVILFFAWVIIIFTGKYPKGMFDFISGYLRWMTRVNGYIYLLTDKYPPFSLS